MKIFISWSGARSRAIAEALNDWLKRVIQAVKPFYSPEIEKGAKWSNELDAALEGTRFGIICLTPDNLSSTWIHYEAGALSKTPDALIWTFLHGINAGDVPQPLGKYQHTAAVKDDVFRLLASINKGLADVGGEPIDGAVLSENFEVYWPKLEEKLRRAEKLGEQKVKLGGSATTEKPRDEREILLEILEIVRSQYRKKAISSTMQDLTFIGATVSVPPDVQVDSETAARIATYIRAILPETEVSLNSDSVPTEFVLVFKNALAEGVLSRLMKQVSDEIGLRLSITRLTGDPAVHWLHYYGR